MNRICIEIKCVRLKYVRIWVGINSVVYSINNQCWFDSSHMNQFTNVGVRLMKMYWTKQRFQKTEITINFGKMANGHWQCRSYSMTQISPLTLCKFSTRTACRRVRGCPGSPRAHILQSASAATTGPWRPPCCPAWWRCTEIRFKMLGIGMEGKVR